MDPQSRRAKSGQKKNLSREERQNICLRTETHFAIARISGTDNAGGLLIPGITPAFKPYEPFPRFRSPNDRTWRLKSMEKRPMQVDLYSASVDSFF